MVEFIGNIAYCDVTIKLITREECDGIFNTHKNLPYRIPYPEEPTVVIEACRYKDGKYLNCFLHDRYILKKNGSVCKGLNIGPSLENIKIYQ